MAAFSIDQFMIFSLIAAPLLFALIAYFTRATLRRVAGALADGLFYGSAVGLIGWRVNRRFGLRGLLVFLALFTVYGSIRDFGGPAGASAQRLQGAPGLAVSTLDAPAHTRRLLPV